MWLITCVINLGNLQLPEFSLVCSFFNLSPGGLQGFTMGLQSVRASCAGQAIQMLFCGAFCFWLFLFTEGRNIISMTFLELSNGCIFLLTLAASLLIFMSSCAFALSLSLAVWTMLCYLIPLYTFSYWALIQLSLSLVSFAFSAFVFASGYFFPMLLIFSFLYRYSFRMLTASFVNLFCGFFLKGFFYIFSTWDPLTLPSHSNCLPTTFMTSLLVKNRSKRDCFPDAFSKIYPQRLLGNLGEILQTQQRCIWDECKYRSWSDFLYVFMY